MDYGLQEGLGRKRHPLITSASSKERMRILSFCADMERDRRLNCWYLTRHGTGAGSGCTMRDRVPGIPMSATLFETISCPLCGNGRFEIVKPSKYSEGVSESELRQAYSASSNHQLLDQVVRCSSCSLHYVNPRPSPELIIEGYAAAEDETFVAQNQGRIRGFQRTLGRILKRKEIPNGSGLRYLDIGCAGGASLVAAKLSRF